mgnify:CR=1 FL=1
MALVLNGSNDTITGLQINSANIVDGSIVNADINDMAASKLTGAIPASTHDVLQTQVYSLSQDFTTTNQSLTEVTNLAVSITPSSSSNKVLLIGNLNMESWGGADRRMVAGVYHTSITDSNRIVRANEGVYASGSGSGYTYGQFSFWYIHSPGTSSAITYKVGIASPDGANVKVGSDGGNAYNLQTYIYAQEIKA